MGCDLFKNKIEITDAIISYIKMEQIVNGVPLRFEIGFAEIIHFPIIEIKPTAKEYYKVLRDIFQNKKKLKITIEIEKE